MIEFIDVCMRFEEKEALKHINLKIYDGDPSQDGHGLPVFRTF